MALRIVSETGGAITASPSTESKRCDSKSGHRSKLGQGPKQSDYVLPDNFWEPLPDDMIAAFNGGDDRS